MTDTTPAICSQCGQTFDKPACGFSHATIQAEKMTDTTPADEFEVWWGKGVGHLDAKDLARFTWEWAYAAGKRQARAASQPNGDPYFLGLCHTLLAALKRLSFAAQTSGGTAGRDEELCAAIARAEAAINASKGYPASQPAQEPVTSLERWGMKSPETWPFFEKVDDGYWTPWHIADAALRAYSYPLTAQVQACRPEDRAMLQTSAGRELLSKVADAMTQPAQEPINAELYRTLRTIVAEELDRRIPTGLVMRSR